MSAGLPAALQDAIARFTEAVTPKDLAARSAALTGTYRCGSGSDQAIRDDRDVAAYLTTRLPATYAAIAAVLGAVRERAPQFSPKRLLDAGAGPGTASWAAAELWPRLDSVTMLDRNPRLLSAARTLAQSSGHQALTNAQVLSADLQSPLRLFEPPPPHAGEERKSAASDFPPPFTGEVLAQRAEGGPSDRAPVYDLVLAGYTIAEIPDHLRERTLARLWDSCRGVLVIVEPGTPAGFARILACRTALLAAGARMVAPCPGAYPCPIVSPDWCHFAERLPRSRAHMRAKAANVPFEDEKFSYVAVAREGIELVPPEARIVGPPHAGKPGVRLRLCTDTGIGERIVLKRDKAAYRAVARKDWGDAL